MAYSFHVRKFVGREKNMDREGVFKIYEYWEI
jgi:hypothetical protein